MPARLACVKPAASVRSEPGSNSQVEELIKADHNINGSTQPTSVSAGRVSTETSNQHHPTHDPGQNPDPQGQRRPRFSFSDALVKEQAGSHRQSSATTGPAPDQGQARRPRLCRRRLSARSAVAAGADALLIEVHPTPEEALKDGMQSISTDEFGALVPRLATVAAAVGTRLAPAPTIARGI